MMRELTYLEKDALAHTAEIWNTFQLLPIIHPDDNNEIRFHIHAIQNIILARPAAETVKKPTS